MKKRVSYKGKIDPKLLPKNVLVEGEELVFSGYDDDTIKGLCKRLSGLVRPEGHAVKYEPTDLDFQAVKAIVGEKIDVSGFGIYRAVISSTQRDTDSDQYSKAVLDEMAAQYSDGRPVVVGHNSTQGVGRTFEAVVLPKDGTSGEYELLCKFYVLPQAAAPTASMKELLDTKVYDRFSIAVYMKILDVVVDEETRSRTYLWDHTTAVVIHLGIVDMGAQTDAHSKSANSEVLSFGEISIESPMKKIEKKYKALGEVSVELDEAGVVGFLDTVEETLVKAKSSITNLKAKLKKFEDAAAEKLKGLREEYVRQKAILNPEEKSMEAFERRASLLDAEALEEDILGMKKEIIAKKKKNQIDPKEKEDGDDGDDDGDKKPKQKMEIQFG